jgi:dipeptidase E
MENKLQRNIIVMGGGGFSDEPDNPLLDDYILKLTRKKIPKICFLPTASGDAQNYIDKFHTAFPDERAKASHLTLFRSCGVENIVKFLCEQDVIYVGGGSTANMLAVWRVHGVDGALRKAWESGVILAGISAGMNCWFEQSVTDSFGGKMAPLKDGLGFLKGSACPHYDSQPGRRPTFQRLITSRELLPGIAADDGAAVHFIGTKIHETISSRPNARAYIVKLTKGEVIETPLETRYLGE